MKKFAILRVEKIKHASKMRRSLAHSFRDVETPNADPDLTPSNAHIGAQSSQEAIERFNDRLSTQSKVRKNAVLAVEYLITASPEILRVRTRKQQDAYFDDALAWLRQRHGAENVFYAGVHRDETSAHMYAYVVPIDKRGKLNCRAFLGGSNALSEMQTDFAAAVGARHGLVRGIKGSKAKHTTMKQYYARVNAPGPVQAPKIEVPEPSLAARLKPDQYGKEVKDAVVKQLTPGWRELQAKAKQNDELRRQKDEARYALKLAKNGESNALAEAAKSKTQVRALTAIVSMFTPQELDAAKARKQRQDAEKAKAEAEAKRQKALEAARGVEAAEKLRRFRESTQAEKTPQKAGKPAPDRDDGPSFG
jgi:hypothetical protein